MTKILFGVCGVGYGHAVRSRILIEYLKKKHEVMIIAGMCAHSYLKDLKNIYWVDGLEFAFKNERVANLNTIFKNIKKISNKNYSQLKNLKNKIDKFKPDAVISDWELFSVYYAKDKKIKLTCFDNEHYLLKGDYKIPAWHKIDYLKAYFITKLYDVENIICVILPGQKFKKNSNILSVMPIIRKQLINKKPNNKDFILVYKSIARFDNLAEVLKKSNDNFVIYGYDIEKKEDNLTFKKFSEDGFCKDLINCKAVICSAGMNLIGEALYLKKPLYLIPVKGHFEQILNAAYVKENNYGDVCEEIKSENVNKFLSDNYKTVNFEAGNEKLFKLVDEFLRGTK